MDRYGRRRSQQRSATQDEEIRRFIEKYENARNQKATAAINRGLAPDYL